ncbi:MAG: permease [Chloroflexota bacterium]
MTIATISLWVIAVVLSVFAWKKQDGSLQSAFSLGWKTFKRNALILLLAFVIVGFVNVLSPQNLIEKLLGPDSGWQGLFLAEALGMILPGGPYAVFPLIGVIYLSGAGLGPVVTLITSWSMLALLTVTFELPFMGWRFTAVRWGLGLAAPLVAGALAALLSG